MAVYQQRDELSRQFKEWSAAREKIAQRQPGWERLRRLLRHTGSLPIAAAAADQARAIEQQRLLLTDPDPVQPLHDQLASALRAALQAR